MKNFSMTTPLNMAPTGIASFAKSKICEDLRTTNADIAILGAPSDLAIQGRSGCRLGPRGIRVASTRFSYKPGGTYDSERGKFYMDSNRWKVEDCGDADYVPGNWEATSNNIEGAVKILVDRGAMPVVLGGDCGVGYPVIKGMEAAGPFDIIHFDAHLDWTRPLDGQKYFNGSPMRNAASLSHVGRILHLGIRGAGSSGPDDFADARAHGDMIYSVKNTRREGIEKILEDFNPMKKVFIAIDIDVMDATCARATASPMFGGFWYEEMVDMFEAIAAKADIVGLVLTEVAPPYDDNVDTTSYLAARMISDVLNFATKRREEAEETK